MFFLDDRHNYSETDSDSDGEDVSALAVKKLKYQQDCEEQRLRTKYKIPPDIDVPMPGTVVDRKQFRKAGPYTIGVALTGHRPVGNIYEFIAKKENTNQFYQLKILEMSECSTPQEQQQGKILLHTEFSILSMLQNEPGVVNQHGLFSDIAYQEKLLRKRRSTYTGSVMKRLILVLDCLVPHPFCDKSTSYVTLQEYIMCVKKLDESEALYVMHEIVKIVESLHKKNIVHRDLKLANIVLNKLSKKVILTNFSLGRYLSNENTLLHEQLGSPAYVSPDVISGKPYKGKPTDMWALGVIFFIMLFGSFPFFDRSCMALLARIRSGQFHIPDDTGMSQDTIDVIRGLLNVDPEERLTVTHLRRKLEAMLSMKKLVTPDQCVPNANSRKRKSEADAENSFTRHSDANEQIVPKFQANEEQTVPTALITTNRPSILEKILKTSKSPSPSQPSSSSSSSYDSPAQSSRSLATSIYSYVHSLTTRSSINVETMIDEFMVVLSENLATGRRNNARISNHNLRNFDGMLTSAFVSRIYDWLVNEFGSNDLVSTVFGSNRPLVNRVKSFLILCGVKVHVSIFGPQITRHQSARVQQMLTSILTRLGYSSEYFVISPPVWV